MQELADALAIPVAAIEQAFVRPPREIAVVYVLDGQRFGALLTRDRAGALVRVKPDARL